MEITLTQTTAADRHVVTNMFTAYFYDMAQYDPHLIINEHGLPLWMPAGATGIRTHDECVRFNWWIRDSCEPYIVRVDGGPAGFVIICAEREHLSEDVDFELMDFYITPKYRRQGVGRQAARAAFNLHQGAWAVYQLPANTPARRFWQQVVATYTGGRYENLDNGTQQRFRNDAGALAS